jgi:hypothetical protein
MGTELGTLIKQYKTFDELLDSGDFARLSQEGMLSVYDHYNKPSHQQNNIKNNSIDPRFAGKLVILGDESLDYALSQEFSKNDDLAEDRSIIQPDGSRACLLWELSGKGYHVVKE